MRSVVSTWAPQKTLFYRQGVTLDKEMWHSVTPEDIAQQVAGIGASISGYPWDAGYARQRYYTNNGIAMDMFAGVGGNTIQLALAGMFLIAIEHNINRLHALQHNSQIYEINKQIDCILCDAYNPPLRQPLNHHSNITLVDFLFLSPPWGGPKYKQKNAIDLSRSLNLINTMLSIERRISRSAAVFLPRNVDFSQGVLELHSHYPTMSMLHLNRNSVLLSLQKDAQNTYGFCKQLNHILASDHCNKNVYDEDDIPMSIDQEDTTDTFKTVKEPQLCLENKKQMCRNKKNRSLETKQVQNRYTTNIWEWKLTAMTLFVGDIAHREISKQQLDTKKLKETTETCKKRSPYTYLKLFTKRLWGSATESFIALLGKQGRVVSNCGDRKTKKVATIYYVSCAPTQCVSPDKKKVQRFIDYLRTITTEKSLKAKSTSKALKLIKSAYCSSLKAVFKRVIHTTCFVDPIKTQTHQNNRKEELMFSKDVSESNNSHAAFQLETIRSSLDLLTRGIMLERHVLALCETSALHFLKIYKFFIIKTKNFEDT